MKVTQAKIIFTLIWALLLVGYGQIFLSGEQRFALLFLVVVFGLNQLTQTPKIILIRRVVHRRLAIVDHAVAELCAGHCFVIGFRRLSSFTLSPHPSKRTEFLSDLLKSFVPTQAIS